MLFFHNRNLKCSFSLKLVPQKEGIISKCFTGQKITPYIDLREQSLYYTVKKTVIFRLQRETL